MRRDAEGSGLGVSAGRRFSSRFAGSCCRRPPTSNPAHDLDIRRKDNCAIVSCGNEELTLNQWFLLLDTLDRCDSDAVIDAGQVAGSLTEMESYLLALHADDSSQLRRHRVAVLLSGNSQPELDFFVLSARNLGLDIESFDCIDTAAAWAAGGHEQTVEPIEYGCAETRLLR